jgi:hypothetical protein
MVANFNQFLRSRFAVIFTAITMLCVSAPALAGGPELGSSRNFWVWDLNVMPPAFRKAEATLRAQGPRTLVYVEKKLSPEQISPAYIERLETALEKSCPKGSLCPQTGVVPFEEAHFGALPNRFSAPDNRLIVLFADLGKYKDHEFDGFFNSYDQLSESEAQREKQHSNEGNIIYINGLRRDESYTNGVIAHELQHLLVFDPDSRTTKDSWLSEALAEGAMLTTGYFSDQLHVDRFAKSTGASPLVSTTYVQYGPQLLFSSFLLDFAGTGVTNLSELSRVPLAGREAVEKFFEARLSSPQSFDAIYSNFISYLFNAQSFGWSLPISWVRTPPFGITMPEITPYKTITSFPANLDGWVYPYAFVAIDLPTELTDTTTVKVEAIRPNAEGPSCARTASPLWKPVGKKRIVVYAVGCEPKSKQDVLHFRLIITDQASPVQH